MRLFLTISLFIIMFSTDLSYAQMPSPDAGCVMGNKLYTNYIGTITSGKNFRHRFSPSPSYDVYTNCVNGDIQTYFQKTNTAQQVLDKKLWDIGCGTGTTYSSLTGTMYFYNLINCPIDDFVPIALLGAGSIGFFFLRKRIL